MWRSLREIARTYSFCLHHVEVLMVFLIIHNNCNASRDLGMGYKIDWSMRLTVGLHNVSFLVRLVQQSRYAICGVTRGALESHNNMLTWCWLNVPKKPTKSVMWPVAKNVRVWRSQLQHDPVWQMCVKDCICIDVSMRWISYHLSIFFRRIVAHCGRSSKYTIKKRLKKKHLWYVIVYFYMHKG